MKIPFHTPGTLFRTAIILILPVLSACSDPEISDDSSRSISSETSNENTSSATPRPEGFNAYWFQGTAEITSYRLEQARYGQIHEGDAVLIFVTEDISKSKQVKLDNPSAAGDDRIKVLKLNFTKNFVTGIYPYSLMTSVFMPVRFNEQPAVLKVSATSQDWCGHSFTQVNKNADGYRYQSFSYFESEGDQTRQLTETMLESELWMRTRMGKSALPVGTLELLPDLQHHRLRHTDYGPEAVTLSLNHRVESDTEWAYSIDYENLDRHVTLFIQKEFPHTIMGWEETNFSGFGESPERLTTRATRLETIMSDYWSKNRVEDKLLREQLDLD